MQEVARELGQYATNKKEDQLPKAQMQAASDPFSFLLK